MSDQRQEKQILEELVANVIATLPKISRAAIDARISFQLASNRRACLDDAIRETELLAAYLRDRKTALGWNDPKDHAA